MNASFLPGPSSSEGDGVTNWEAQWRTELMAERHMEGEASYRGGYSSSQEVSGWAIGFIAFAAMLMMLMGGFHAFAGLVAIIDNAFFTQPREYFTDFTPETWGWVHLIGGIIVFAAGVGLLSGALWARIIAVIIALASAVINFAFLPYYPVWAIIMIAISIGVIWALTVHGRDVAEVSEY
jgi:hypothetical protein